MIHLPEFTAVSIVDNEIGRALPTPGIKSLLSRKPWERCQDNGWLAYYLERMAPGNRPFAGQTIIIDLIDKASTELQDFAHKHLKEPLPLEGMVGVGKPAEETLRVAREEGVDLIVMGTHGHTGLRHLLLGSVAEEVTRHAPCPVFTIRRHGEAQA